MKTSKSFYQSRLWYKISFALMPAIFLMLVSSCQKVGFEDEMHPAATFTNAALVPANNAILYYGTETFKIVSSDEPLVVTRTLTNPDFRYFKNFVLKVQNGKGNSNKNVTLEILIDDVLIISSSDFTKGNNVVQKELPALKQGSLLEVRIEGGKNRSITLLIECSIQEDVISDIDGNYYHTVKIGEHWYTTENLKVTKFNDGTPIPLIEDNGAWRNLWIIDPNPFEVYDFPGAGWQGPAYCWYNNDISNKDTYGALYTASVANKIHLKDGIIEYGNVCPVGWHVGMPVEIFIREGGTWNDAGIYKESGTEHWVSPNTGATNSTGFTALPGGYREGGLFAPFWRYLGYTGNWWSGYSQSDHGMHGGTFIHMHYDDTDVFEDDSTVDGMSIRCMK